MSSSDVTLPSRYGRLRATCCARVPSLFINIIMIMIMMVILFMIMIILFMTMIMIMPQT